MDKRWDIFESDYASKDQSEALECGRMHSWQHDSGFHLIRSDNINLHLFQPHHLTKLKVLYVLASVSDAFARQLHDGWNLPNCPRQAALSEISFVITRSVESIPTHPATAESCSKRESALTEVKAELFVLPS